MRALVSIAMLLVCVAAEAKRGTVIIAPVNSLGVSAGQARRIHRWLQAAASDLAEFRWRSPERLERKLQEAAHFACRTKPLCMGRLLGEIGVDVAVMPDVGSVGDAYVIYLQAIGAQGVIASASEIVDPRTQVRKQVRALLVQLLAPRRYSGSIVVNADVAGAWVYLDGRRVARGRRTMIDAVPVGTHALRVTHERYHDFVRFVKVGFEQDVSIAASLTAFPIKSKRMHLLDANRPLTDRELPWYRRSWAVAVFGAAILVTAATVVALIPHSVARDATLTVVPP